MATSSTPQQNDTTDNRVEYAPPPCAETNDDGRKFDENGVEVEPDESPLAGR